MQLQGPTYREEFSSLVKIFFPRSKNNVTTVDKIYDRMCKFATHTIGKRPQEYEGRPSATIRDFQGDAKIDRQPQGLHNYKLERKGADRTETDDKTNLQIMDATEKVDVRARRAKKLRLIAVIGMVQQTVKGLSNDDRRAYKFCHKKVR